jgi:multidrug efflux pump subunit AcrB
VNRAIEWFARNHVAANLLMFGILAAGLMTVGTIKQTIFPDFETNYVSVTVVYPGASPVDIEKSVTLRIEEELQDVDGIEQMRSSANEGATNVLIEIEDGADVSKALDEIDMRVNSIDTFPEETEKPIVQEILFKMQVMDIAVHGNVDERSLKEFGQRVRDDVSQLPGVSQVELVGARPYEIAIEVSEAALQQYGLRFDDVAFAVRRTSLDLPGGSVKTRSGEILLRTEGQAYWGREFERIPLVTREDGARVTVGDVATVRDAFQENDKYATLNGEPAVFVQVYRVGQQQALEVAKQVNAYLDGARAQLPEGVSLTVWEDDSKFLGERIDMMLSNARMGFVLVLVLLAIFLKLRVAFWVAVGLPVSVAGGIALMPWLGIDINILSVFAFIMALGILVDDAIVTGENVYTHLERNPDEPLEAAIKGTHEVATPVVFGVLTTIAAFLPFQLIGGHAKVMAVSIGGVMMAALLFSLIESKLVLPSHLAHWSGMDKPPRTRVGKGWARFQSSVARRMRHFVENVYGPAVRQCVEWRYLTLATSVAVFVVALSVVMSGHVKSVMMPPMEMDGVSAGLEMPLGTPVAETAEAVARLEAAALELARELEENRRPGEPQLVENRMAMVGDRRSFGPDQRRSSSGQSHLGQVDLRLSPSEKRSISAPDVAERWRELTGTIPGVEELTFHGQFRHFGDPVDVELRAEDIAMLREAAARLQVELARYPGVHDIRDSYVEGKQELQLAIKPAAEALGLSLEDLGRQVRQAFYGAEAQRIQRGRDEVKVMVRYPESERRALSDVQNMRIRLPDGTAVPFAAVAEATLDRGPASIHRIDRRRRLRVTADIDEEVANAVEIAQEISTVLMPALLRDYPRLSWSFRGEREEAAEAFGGLKRGAVVAMILIFILLAVPLRSYFQAVVIMLAIPFGYVGAVLGHWLYGTIRFGEPYAISFLSMIGVLACAGVVVNDSLVLVTFMNRLREEGVSLLEAAVQAGQRRFRAIMLTSLTTFAGLTPIYFDLSSQSQMVTPMAVSLGFGVVIATGFTLLMIPAAMLVVEDVKNGAAIAWRWIVRLPAMLRDESTAS